MLPEGMDLHHVYLLFEYKFADRKKKKDNSFESMEKVNGRMDWMYELVNR